MQIDVDKHFFTHGVVTIQGTFAEPPHVNVEMFIGVLLGSAKFGEGVSGLSVEKIAIV